MSYDIQVVDLGWKHVFSKLGQCDLPNVLSDSNAVIQYSWSTST
jgi:hypothetical protein